MTLVIGTDEAGYGPNLGPLAVAASAWRVAAEPEHVETVLEAALEAAAIAADPAPGITKRIWSDSKQVYRGGGRHALRGLAALETGVLTAVAMSTGRIPDGWPALAATLAESGKGSSGRLEHPVDVLPSRHDGHIRYIRRGSTFQTPRNPRCDQATAENAEGFPRRHSSHPAVEEPAHPPRVLAADTPATPEWPTLMAVSLPRAIDAAGCLARAGRIVTALEAAGVVLERIACRLVQPRAFNALLDAGLNKSDILSQTTLELAADLRRGTDDPTVIWCDRHGGRKHYAPIVSRHFECPLVRPITETAERSAYDLPAARCRIEFSVGGEHRGPVALASMTAKYVRELSMQAFNDFWSARSPGLAPTAGYPVDAARWRRDAAPAVAAAGVEDNDLWRRA